VSPPPFPFETRAALHEWLEAEGLSHLAKLNLEAVAPFVEPGLWSQLKALGARRRLVDLAARDSLARWVDGLPPSRFRDELPPLTWKALAQWAVEAHEARGTLKERLRAPGDARKRPVFERVLGLRETMPPSVAPRLLLPLDALRFDAELPGFRFEELLASEMPLRTGQPFARPKVTLALSRGGAKRECTCGQPHCVHQLAALDTVLAWLREPLTPEREAQLQALEEPPWERALKALDEALEGPTAPTTLELWWQVEGEGELGVDVSPWWPKPPRKVSGALTRARLLKDLSAHLSTDDVRLVALLPEDRAFASRALLDALVNHPRLVLAGTQRPVRLERTALGVVAEERGGTVQLAPGLEGAALPKSLAQRVRRAKSDEVLFLWDEGPCRLTLLDVKPELRALLEVLAREGDAFPPESHPALLASLAKWAQRVPVAMPRSVLGESAPAELVPVLRIEASESGAVRVEVRLRPLPGAAAVIPGVGARDVHVRQGERALHAVRALAHEVPVAQRLAQALPWRGAEGLPEPFTWRFEEAAGALELLAAAAKLEPAPTLEWVGAPVKTLGTRGPQALKVVLEKRRDWFGVLGELSVEGERVTLARLLDAARRKERYVRVQARTYVELTAELRRHLETLSAHVHVTHQGLELGPSSAEALRLLERDGATLEADVAWRQLAERIEAARALTPEVPKGLEAELRSYQEEGFRWLMRLASWGAGGVLADDMGLGKTLQALTVLLARRDQGPALVLAPTSVAFNWKEEAERFTPGLRVHVYAEAGDRDRALRDVKAGDVLVVSYGLLVRDAERLASTHFATLVFDEAQHLKNATTQRFRAARGLSADFRFALSGTPVENNVGELWSQCTAVFPGLLGSWEAFRHRYAAPIERQDDPTAAPALAAVLAPFMLRRTKAQVEAELPPRTEVRVPVSFSAAERQLYEDARLSALAELESKRPAQPDQERRVEVLAALTRLRLLASHPRLYEPSSSLASSKLERLMELLQELLAEGQRTLIFSQFTSHLALVREALDAQNIGHLSLEGRTPARARKQLVQRFQEGTTPVFLISLKAGGFGLNLTAATNVIHLDPWWNPAVEDQASDRAHRMGQTRPVTIYRLVTLGTIEEQMLQLHESKRALVGQLLEGKDVAAKVSTQELLAMLSRRLTSPIEGP
jgi:superfamily II DNA or RNA helicase